MSLDEFLKAHIAQHGPMDVGQYMGFVLGHPAYGYYMKQDPLGADGDFTTAPEISQIFGELIGAYMADLWMQLDQPDPFVLLECGPGRGTLMADMMRAMAGVEGFREACHIHLLETSPVLKEKQAKALEEYDPVWHEGLDSVPDDRPMLVVANEFLDALPVRQIVMTDEGWQERVVSYSDEFHFGLVAAGPELLGDVPEASPGDIFEIASARENFVRSICDLLKKSGGAALFIDYGHVSSGCGDTLQAVYRHEYASVFDHIGNADLTAHVDFEAIARIAGTEGVDVAGPVEQGAFLRSIGIEARANTLKAQASPEQGEDIEKALHRLTHSDEMGALFKVIGVSHGTS